MHIKTNSFHNERINRVILENVSAPITLEDMVTISEKRGIKSKTALNASQLRAASIMLALPVVEFFENLGTYSIRLGTVWICINCTQRNIRIQKWVKEATFTDSLTTNLHHLEESATTTRYILPDAKDLTPLKELISLALKAMEVQNNLSGKPVYELPYLLLLESVISSLNKV